jgi:hypothetical protein
MAVSPEIFVIIIDLSGNSQCRERDMEEKHCFILEVNLGLRLGSVFTEEFPAQSHSLHIIVLPEARYAKAAVQPFRSTPLALWHQSTVMTPALP